MRRLRDVVSQPCRPGGRGLPSAATTSGCHRLAGRGWEAGGEIRRRSTETPREHLRESVPSPEARSPVLKNRRRWSAGRRFRGRCSPSHGEYVAALYPKRASRRSVSPHQRGENQKLTPRGSAGTIGRGCLTFKSGRRCGDRACTDRAIEAHHRLIITVVPAKAGTHTPCRS
jgi:hypothetical protein